MFAPASTTSSPPSTRAAPGRTVTAADGRPCAPYDPCQIAAHPTIADLKPAPFTRRFVAGLIDAGLMLPTMAGAGLAAWTLRHWWPPITRPLGEGLRRRVEARSAEPPWSFELTRVRRALLTVASLIVAVATRNSRTPGSRLLGIRKVQLRDGQPVSIRSAVIHFAVQSAESALMKRVLIPLASRERDAVEPELRRLRAERRGDPDRVEQGAHGELVIPLRSCAWLLLMILVRQVPRLWSPYRLALPDQVAGTLIVLEDPRHSRRAERKSQGRG